MRNRMMAFLVFASLTAPTAGAQCGGDERWWVKVGADAGAVGLASQSPTNTSLHDLVLLPRPVLPNDEETRVDAEKAVRTIDAFLVKFKKESGKTGDQDYHLVIADGTLLYSKGGSGPASPHSLIAEIPDPRCVSGRNQTVTGPSHLATQLAQVRSAFEERFPTPTAGWNVVDGIPVRLTGVVFFDRPHGQVGRALNGLELHPLLGIEFNPAALPVPHDTMAEVRVTNAGFEDGATGWTASDGVIAKGGPPAARTGDWRAWLGGHGEKMTDRLSQDLRLPADAGAVSVTFYLHVETEEESTTPYDYLRVRVRDTTGKLLKTVATFSNVDAIPGYHRQTIDLSAYRGKTVRLAFESSEDGASSTSFVIDDVRLVVERH